MILDDGKGMAIDTESKPPTLEQQITELRNKIGAWGVDRKERQRLKTQLEKLTVQLKKRARAEAKKKT